MCKIHPLFHTLTQAGVCKCPLRLFFITFVRGQKCISACAMSPGINPPVYQLKNNHPDLKLHPYFQRWDLLRSTYLLHLLSCKLRKMLLVNGELSSK